MIKRQRNISQREAGLRAVAAPAWVTQGESWEPGVLHGTLASVGGGGWGSGLASTNARGHHWSGSQATAGLSVSPGSGADNRPGGGTSSWVRNRALWKPQGGGWLCLWGWGGGGMQQTGNAPAHWKEGSLGVGSASVAQAREDRKGGGPTPGSQALASTCTEGVQGWGGWAARQSPSPGHSVSTAQRAGPTGCSLRAWSPLAFSGVWAGVWGPRERRGGTSGCAGSTS